MDCGCERGHCPLSGLKFCNGDQFFNLGETIRTTHYLLAKGGLGAAVIDVNCSCQQSWRLQHHGQPREVAEHYNAPQFRAQCIAYIFAVLVGVWDNHKYCQLMADTNGWQQYALVLSRCDRRKQTLQCCIVAVAGAARTTQTDPPSVPIKQLFHDSVFPEGEWQSYKDDNLWRETSAEKRELDRLQWDMVNDVRQAAEVHRTVS